MATNLSSGYLPGSMSNIRKSILQVNTSNAGGGAAKVASDLARAYRAMGHNAWLVVGEKIGNNPQNISIQNDSHRNWWTRACLAAESGLLESFGRRRGAGRIASWLHGWIGQPKRMLERQLGHEDFDFPGSHQLLALAKDYPDLIHCHNLHGSYFDLRTISDLSNKVPVVMTLHDAWLLSGHCAHSFDCEKWKAGCGNCPDLSIYPEVLRDATARNWQLKKSIYSRSQIYVATPSQWLMNRVNESNLVPSIVDQRVINNGVDLSVFFPADKRMAREILGIPQNASVLLFAANGIKRKIWRDYESMRATVEIVSQRLPDQNVVFLAVGEEEGMDQGNQSNIRLIPYQSDPKVVANYYVAADVYIHAALADTFPTAIVEALACGTPVVASAVGGIPEQVRGLDTSPIWPNTTRESDSTGILTEPGNPQQMAQAAITLLTDEELHKRLSENAAQDALRRFDMRVQVNKYLDWYSEILFNRSAELSATHPVAEAIA